VLDLLPISALSDGLRVVLGRGGGVPLDDWLTLLIWAGVAGAAASRWFRWD
jgi:ABC-2 type transport system permease protein